MAIQRTDGPAEAGEDLELSFFNEKECHECGKKFFSSGEWVYKLKINGKWRYYCSWGCMRTDERRNKTKKRDLMAEAVTGPREKKQPQDRKTTAYGLVDAIRAGKNPIDYLKSLGYGNPYEAYSATRHYAITNLTPAISRELKPLRELNRGRKTTT